MVSQASVSITKRPKIKFPTVRMLTDGNRWLRPRWLSYLLSLALTARVLRIHDYHVCSLTNAKSRLPFWLKLTSSAPVSVVCMAWFIGSSSVCGDFVFVSVFILYRV